MNYVFEEDGNKLHAEGLTHQKRTKDKYGKWHKNMPLVKNAQQGKFDKSYIRYGYITQNKNTFSKPDKRFDFSSEDFPNVKSKIRYYKKTRK